MDKAKDIRIREISSVYTLATLTWSRPRAIPKHTNTIAYFKEGSVTYFFEDDTVTASGGDILVLPKGVVYSGEKVLERNSYIIIEFETEEKDELSLLSLDRVISAPASALRLFERIHECYNKGEMILLRRYLYELIHTLLKRSPEEKTVNDIISFIRERLGDTTLSVPHICEAFSISESSLRRLFKRELGMSPIEYVKGLRLSLAKDMLLQGDISVGEVAELCGYSSLYYFSRDFKRKTGVAPSAWMGGI